MIKELARRALEAISPDPQTLVLLKAGGRGALNAGAGLLTAWDGWTAPLVSKLRSGGVPLAEAPACPQIDLAVDDPIAALVAAPEFAALGDHFARIDQAERSLVSAVTQALLYALVRNLRPETVVEIGTFRASTSRAIARALHANGRGIVHTVDPLNRGPIMRLIHRWPPELRERVCYHPTSSMDFFNLALFWNLDSDLVFVDGNHDYEYALFDILSAARLIRPGGFIAIDNIGQGGPFHAARDFLRDHQSWRECGHCLASERGPSAFDPARSTIANTDLCVIRAPLRFHVGKRFSTRGQQKIAAPAVGGVELSIATPASGTLFVQYVVRVRERVMSETTTETQVSLHHVDGTVRVTLPWVFSPGEVPFERTIELWLGWSGEKELELAAPPAFY